VKAPERMLSASESPAFASSLLSSISEFRDTLEPMIAEPPPILKGLRVTLRRPVHYRADGVNRGSLQESELSVR